MWKMRAAQERNTTTDRPTITQRNFAARRHRYYLVGLPIQVAKSRLPSKNISLDFLFAPCAAKRTDPEESKIDAYTHLRISSHHHFADSIEEAVKKNR